MSLFRYKVLLADGKEKESKITAKTKEAAQTQVAKLNKVMEWIWIKEDKGTTSAPSLAKPTTLTKPAITAKSNPKTKPASAGKTSVTKQTRLDKLLYLQNGNCFFCGQVLNKAEASVEHLLPKSRGGTDEDGNVVACCVTLNRTFGNMELRDKVKFVLAQKGEFRCPKF